MFSDIHDNIVTLLWNLICKWGNCAQIVFSLCSGPIHCVHAPDSAADCRLVVQLQVENLKSFNHRSKHNLIRQCTTVEKSHSTRGNDFALCTSNPTAATCLGKLQAMAVSHPHVKPQHCPTGGSWCSSGYHADIHG